MADDGKNPEEPSSDNRTSDSRTRSSKDEQQEQRSKPSFQGSKEKEVDERNCEVKATSKENAEPDATTPPEIQQRSDNDNEKIEGKHTVAKKQTSAGDRVDELGNKIKRQEAKVRNAISNTGLQKTLQKAQEKHKPGRKKRLSADSTDEGLFKENDDDDNPVTTMAEIEEANPFLTDRTHRADLNLVRNNKDNNGILFLGDRPFWKSKYEGDDMPMIERRTTSQICVEIRANKTLLKADLPPVSGVNAFGSKEVLEDKNKYFSTQRIERNTIVSMIQTYGGADNEESRKPKQMDKKPSAKKKTKKEVIKKDLKVGTITEPTMAISYKKYEIKKRATVQFARSGLGVCKKQPKKGLSSDPSSESDSTTSANSNKASKAPPPTTPASPAVPKTTPKPAAAPVKVPALRKKVTLRKGVSKK